MQWNDDDWALGGGWATGGKIIQTAWINIITQENYFVGQKNYFSFSWISRRANIVFVYSK